MRARLNCRIKFVVGCQKRVGGPLICSYHLDIVLAPPLLFGQYGPPACLMYLSHCIRTHQLALQVMSTSHTMHGQELAIDRATPKDKGTPAVLTRGRPGQLPHHLYAASLAGTDAPVSGQGLHSYEQLAAAEQLLGAATGSSSNQLVSLLSTAGAQDMDALQNGIHSAAGSTTNMQVRAFARFIAGWPSRHHRTRLHSTVFSTAHVPMQVLSICQHYKHFRMCGSLCGKITTTSDVFGMAPAAQALQGLPGFWGHDGIGIGLGLQQLQQQHRARLAAHLQAGGGALGGLGLATSNAVLGTAVENPATVALLNGAPRLWAAWKDVLASMP